MTNANNIIETLIISNYRCTLKLAILLFVYLLYVYYYRTESSIEK